MAPCDVDAAALQLWQRAPVGGQHGSFALRLEHHPDLCIAGGGTGTHLQVQACDGGNPRQAFAVRGYGQNGTDVVGVAGNPCPCLNVNDNAARSKSRCPRRST